MLAVELAIVLAADQATDQAAGQFAAHVAGLAAAIAEAVQATAVVADTCSSEHSSAIAESTQQKESIQQLEDLPTEAIEE